MVFMPVGEDNSSNLVPVLQQVRDVRNHNIHAQQLGLRKHQAGIDHDHVIAPADGHAVHSELAQPAQRRQM